MAATRIIYVCEKCLTVQDTPLDCCNHTMIKIDAGEPGSERSKPVMTKSGELRSRAPRWWIERHGPIGTGAGSQ